MNLQTELHDLTASQPAQPGDRLSAVTGKARRIRRTRAALSVVAVLAVAAPVGLALQPHHRAATQYAGVSTWPDRSQSADRQVAEGAVQQRHQFRIDDPVGDVHWLYRGTVTVPDGSKDYVAIWREAGQLVTAYVNRAEVGNNGIPDGGFADGNDSANTPWLIYSTKDVDSPAVGVYLPYDMSQNDNKGAVLVLTDPSTTSLHWGVTLLANAPAGDGGRRDAGELTGSKGVFFGDTGSTVGPLTVTTLGSDKPLLTQPLAIPNQDLLRPGLSDLPAGFAFVEGGAGEFTDRADDGRSVGHASEPLAHAALFARCYGSGAITVHVGDKNAVVGRAVCDGVLHEVFRDHNLGRNDSLDFTGTGRQVWRFQLGTLR